MYELLLSNVQKALEFRDLLSEKLGKAPCISISAANLVTMYVKETRESDFHTNVIELLDIDLQKERTTQNALKYVYETREFRFTIGTFGCFGGGEATKVERPRTIYVCPVIPEEAEGP